jgi:transposase
MRIVTLLNRCMKFKRFVHEKASFDAERIVVDVRPRTNSKARCGDCQQPAPTYDTASEPREFEFIPTWGFAVFLRYRMRRVSYETCGVTVEEVPWAKGKQRKTLPYLAFLASWDEDLPWQRVAQRFHTSWQSVYRAVQWVVEYGLAHRRLDNVEAIGVDEIQYQKGHKYLTVVYQLDARDRRLLWVGQKRTIATLEGFFTDMTAAVPTFKDNVKFVCSDMWRAYLRVIREQVPKALHVLDRFHIRKKFSEAVDKVRRQEVRRLRQAGADPVLTKSRWCFLKKRGNLTSLQRGRLKDLLKMNLRTVRAYLLAEQFEHFWTYTSPTWAGKFLKSWTRQAMYSRIEPMKGVAKMLRRHEQLILNWFRARKQINNGITEGLNLNIKLAMRKARGFRSYDVARVAFYHQLGKLPKPEFEHQFW